MTNHSDVSVARLPYRYTRSATYSVTAYICRHTQSP